MFGVKPNRSKYLPNSLGLGSKEDQIAQWTTCTQVANYELAIHILRHTVRSSQFGAGVHFLLKRGKFLSFISLIFLLK